jgi:uncharacterized protein (TIRG00374 family)
MNQDSQTQQVSIKHKFFRLNTLAAFIVAGVIIYVFVTRFDFSEVIAIIERSQLIYIIAGAAIFYGFLPLRGYRWQVFLKESGIILPLIELVRFYSLAWFVNSILPARIGDVYRAYLLKKNDGISFPLSLGVLFSERVFDLASIACLVLLGGIFYLGKITSADLRNSVITALLIVGIIVILFAIFSWRSQWLVRFMPQKLRIHFESFTKGIFRSPSKIPLLFIQSLLIWLSEAARLYFVALAIGYKIDFLLALFVSQAALIIMSLPLTPAGLGLVELLMFAVLLPTGFSRETSAAIIIADRLISYWLLIILGGLHYIFSPRCR